MAFKKSENFTQDTNNPRLMTDRNELDAKKDYILERSQDERSDEIRFIKKQAMNVNSHVLLATVTDIHAGGQGFDARRCKLAINEVAKCFNAHIYIGGDSVDNANNNPNCATNSFGNRVRPSESPEVVYDLLNDRDVKSKIVAILGGNHDAEYGNRNKQNDTSISHHIADALGVDYVPYGLIYSIPLLTPDTHEVKYQNYLFIHDAGSLDKALRLVNVVKEETGLLLDGIMIEHLHQGQEALYTVPVPVYDKNGKRLGDKNHEVYIGMGYSFQNGSTIYGSQNMFGQKTNLRVYDLSWQLNPYYTHDKSTEEPKYKPCINAFNALAQDADEPSMLLKMYQKKYALGISKNYESNWSKKPLEKITTELNKKTEDLNNGREM